MAVIQYTALVNQIRGKLNGSVLNKSRTINTVQKKQQQPQGQRGFQSEIRQTFSSGQRHWKELTPVQQASWQACAANNPSRDRFGNQVILSGYNQYIKAVINNSYAGLSTPDSAFTGAAPGCTAVDIAFQNTTFSSSLQDGVVFSTTIDMDLSDRTTNFGWCLDISLPISAGVTSYHGRWVNVAGTPNISSLPRNISQSLGTYYPLPSTDQRILYRLRIIHRATGQAVSEYIDQLPAFTLLPVIESFTVAPTSGPAPYVFSAIFSNKGSLDGVVYSFKAFSSLGYGSCPSAASITTLNTGITMGLLSSGSYTEITDINNGECFGVKAQIIREADGHVMQQSVIYISNL